MAALSVVTSDGSWRLEGDWPDAAEVNRFLTHLEARNFAAALGAPQTNVSQHLALFRERGLVDTERRGASIIYSLRYPELIDVVDQLRAVLRCGSARRDLGSRAASG